MVTKEQYQIWKKDNPEKEQLRRQRISQTTKGRKGCVFVMTDKIKQKISKTVSKIMKKQYASGERKSFVLGKSWKWTKEQIKNKPIYNKGKTWEELFDKETIKNLKENLREINKKRTGKKNPAWKGGKNKIIYCKICDNEIHMWNSQYQKYCSSICRTYGKSMILPWNFNKTLGKGFYKNRQHNSYISNETKKKISEKQKILRGLWHYKIAHKPKCGPEHPCWKGGPKKYPWEFNKTLKEKIKKRDNYQCKICNKYETHIKRKLDIHHIDYNTFNLQNINLISLCRNCHMKTNFNRTSWKKYFNNILGGKK